MSFGYTIGDRFFFSLCHFKSNIIFSVKIRARKFSSKTFQAPPPRISNGPCLITDRYKAKRLISHNKLLESTNLIVTYPTSRHRPVLMASIPVIPVKTNHPISSNSHHSATANIAIYCLLKGGGGTKNQREHHII